MIVNSCHLFMQSADRTSICVTASIGTNDWAMAGCHTVVPYCCLTHCVPIWSECYESMQILQLDRLQSSGCIFTNASTGESVCCWNLTATCAIFRRASCPLFGVYPAPEALGRTWPMLVAT
jgi:hypothetical protein